MNLYRIKRKSDNKYYRNRSRFTKYGTYFRLEQLQKNLHWVLKNYDKADLEIKIYHIKDGGGLELSDQTDKDDVLKMINRDNFIEEILRNDET